MRACVQREMSLRRARVCVCVSCLIRRRAGGICQRVSAFLAGVVAPCLPVARPTNNPVRVCMTVEEERSRDGTRECVRP